MLRSNPVPGCRALSIPVQAGRSRLWLTACVRVCRPFAYIVVLVMQVDAPVAVPIQVVTSAGSVAPADMSVDGPPASGAGDGDIVLLETPSSSRRSSPVVEARQEDAAANSYVGWLREIAHSFKAEDAVQLLLVRHLEVPLHNYVTQCARNRGVLIATFVVCGAEMGLLHLCGGSVWTVEHDNVCRLQTVDARVELQTVDARVELAAYLRDVVSFTEQEFQALWQFIRGKQGDVVIAAIGDFVDGTSVWF